MIMGETIERPNATSYPSDLMLEVQTTLAALADVENWHEIVRGRLECYTGPDDKKRQRRKLAARYQAERTPLVRWLAFLQQALTWAMMVQWQRETAAGTHTVLVFRQQVEAPLHACGWSA